MAAQLEENLVLSLLEDALKMPATVFSSSQKKQLLKWYYQLTPDSAKVTFPPLFSFLSSFPLFFFSPFLFRLSRSSFFLVIYTKPQNKQTGLLGDEEEDENNEWQLCDVDETKPVVSVVQGDLALEELTIKNSDEELAAVRSEFSAGNDVYVTLDFTVPDKEAKILSHRCE